MKFALIATCFVSLFVVSESSFTDGMTYGFIVNNIERKIAPEPVKKIDYYNFTRDTSLQKFPPIYAPQCITEKRRIIDPLSAIVEILLSIMIISASMCCIIMCAPDDEYVTEWFVGYSVGRAVENMLNDND
tara:strand:+ start:117 stop:509 length:393 start_codon:yes stop_codon:yes gene_type:complete